MQSTEVKPPAGAGAPHAVYGGHLPIRPKAPRELSPTTADLVARIIAAALVRGYPHARELSDELYAAGYRLPLLNWPTSAFETLAHYRDRTAGLRDSIGRAA